MQVPLRGAMFYLKHTLSQYPLCSNWQGKARSLNTQLVTFSLDYKTQDETDCIEMYKLTVTEYGVRFWN